MKNVTIKDVAKAAGVSYSTVSRALSGSPEISADTRERILRLCRDMNYISNTVTKSMVAKSTRLLGVILPSINNPFMSELSYYIDRQARARGFNTILCSSSHEPEQERELFELMLSRQVDGIIFIPSYPESRENLEPYLSRVPTVFLGENLRDSTESYVAVDNFRGAYMGVEYLYQLGHRDILYFGQRRRSTTHQLRAEGYLSACKALGLTPQFYNNIFSTTSSKYGYQLAKQLFSEDYTYTAIFASTDTNALGIIEAAEEANIRIPEKFSLLGFDNIKSSGLPGINLTTIEQPKKMLASIAVDTVLDMIQSEHAGYTHRIVVPSLVERSSCAAI